MYHLHMQVFDATTEAVRTFADAYASLLRSQLALSGAWSTPEYTADTDAAGAKSWAAAAAMPRMPEPGRSWYRPPYENPMLAFWDEMLRPWRTFAPSAWPAVTPFPTATPFAANPGFSLFMPWLDFYSQMLASPPWTLSAGALQASASTPEPQSDRNSLFSPIATAKIVFADNTEVTITVPGLPPFFGLAGWPTRS